MRPLPFGCAKCPSTFGTLAEAQEHQRGHETPPDPLRPAREVADTVREAVSAIWERSVYNCATWDQVVASVAAAIEERDRITRDGSKKTAREAAAESGQLLYPYFAKASAQFKEEMIARAERFILADRAARPDVERLRTLLEEGADVAEMAFAAPTLQRLDLIRDWAHRAREALGT